ncbi:MAG: Protein NnrS [Candidatus Tokpelaia hoelldobleri]|uniref:Protein NnrS n=1 Tax=Candidatus Tokpelaia hoelldobleri TaxID=1902579 RepID=A0A1U9JW44_9HYPH|nr:MAG: Protein NnrS [Candidatus Tokpelaia hoelldoblerii]
MATSAKKMRAWRGPAILSYGYRPFFLCASLVAVFAMIVFIILYAGYEILPIGMDAISWHAHMFLFGYLWAVITGFLMTAVPNWTGRFPIVGWPLSGLFGLWLLGRVAISLSAWLPDVLTIILDLLFPVALVVVIGCEIIHGKNWRNLKVLVIVSVLLLANILFDYAIFYDGSGVDSLGERLAVGAAIMLITLIGGRIVPSFTRNWLAKHNVSRLPAPHDGFDKLALALTAIALLLWVFAPVSAGVGAVAVIAGVFNLVRLVRWHGWLTIAEPLVWVLHLGYLFVPLGFLGIGYAVLAGRVDWITAFQHLWMAGGIGLMTLAVMTRASLGHSGRPLTVSRVVASLYVMLFVSVFLRLWAGLAGNLTPLLHSAAGLWILAFTGFVVLYWKVLTKPRLPGT